MDLKKIYKKTYQLGYDSVNAPDEISPDSCQLLQNLFPGHPNPTPRKGMSLFVTNNLGAVTVFNMFPWDETAIPKILIVAGSVSSKGLYWMKEGDVTPATINATLFPAGEDVSFVRVADSAYLFTNKLSSTLAFIIKWNGTGFDVRNANIARPAFVVTPSRTGAGNVTASKYVSFAFTLVRREDAASQDVGGNPDETDYATGTFHPGILESIDDLDNRTVWNNATVGGSTISFSVSKGAAVIDTQVTHLRIYATLEFSTQAEAEGAEHRWWKDIPVSGTNAFSWPVVDTYNQTSASMAGNDNFDKMIGFDNVPEAKTCLYHQGRIWLAGAGTGQNIGRVYYSELPQDAEYPQKWYSMFNRVLGFKDVSLDDIEAVKGMSISRNDIFILMNRSLWYLSDGDPELGNPRLVDSAKGTEFPNSIFTINDEIYYLSNDGPAVISGRKVEALQEFTAAEVWPKDYLGQRGYFFGLADKTTVRGFYYKETFFLSTDNICIGHYMPKQIRAIGPFSIVPGDASVKFGVACVVNTDLCVVCSIAEEAYFHEFLDTDTDLDIASQFLIKSKSKEFYASNSDLEVWGECYNLVMFVNFTDTATLKVRLLCDFVHFGLTVTYRDWDTSHLLGSQNLSTKWRESLLLPLPEGLGFQHISIDWEKLHRTPYDFELKGFKLNYLPKKGNLVDFVSPDIGDIVNESPNVLLWLEYDEDSDSISDLSIYERNHTYTNSGGGSRVFIPSSGAGGGMSFVAGTASEVADTDYQALDDLTSAGLWEYEWTIELVFSCSTLATVQILEEGGNGTTVWRWYVAIDGSLHFIIQTYDSSAVLVISNDYSTAAGTIVANGIYTGQFVLSNYGMTGKFYVGIYNGVFVNNLTTQAVLAA